MATPKLTSDQTNFVYFGIAAVEEIPRILRKLLESQIQPHNLPSAVTNCTTLKLRQEQRCLVCPNSTQDPDYEAFDVTLLYTLLRNLCPAFKPTRGWGINPFNSHLCVGDDIERLRYLRNNSFAHLKSSSISDSDFQKLWSSLEDICKRIEIKMKTLSSSIHYQIGLGDILQKDFGMESLEFYQSFIALDNQNVHRKLSEISKNVDKLVLEQEKKTSKLQICGPSIVEYGADAEFYIKFDGESNNNIHYVSWIRREGAVAHEIDIKNEKYEGSLNEKLMIRNVSFEDNGKYQAIMLELNQTHIHSNQIDLTVSGRIPCVILSGPKSVRFGDTAEICSTIQSDLPILEKKWIINDKNKLMDIDIQTFKYQGSTLHVQTSRLFIHNTNFGDQCIYHFAVSNAIGEVRSDPFVLRVLGSVPRITIGHITDLQARSVRIMTDISIDEHSPPVSSIHWSKDGKPIAENTAKYRFLQENQRSLCILNIDEYDAGLYKCVVANLVGKAESEIVQLGPPEITLKEGTDTEISTTFSARVLSVPSVTTLNWEKIITTDNKPQCIPINIMDSMYQDSCNLCPFPKLVVKKIEAIKLQKIKLIAENFVGKTDVIIDVPEFIKSNQEDNLKRQVMGEIGNTLFKEGNLISASTESGQLAPKTTRPQHLLRQLAPNLGQLAPTQDSSPPL
ncbi:matrix-remodeling-associated protein 5-like [Saccostrea cucullata]|uniref:matrix-remodeling-associated protein 5-like n=1 Tax=Saccostrea cuccullata TaxID=36930 RepID=UPI002ED0E9C8